MMRHLERCATLAVALPLAAGLAGCAVNSLATPPLLRPVQPSLNVKERGNEPSCASSPCLYVADFTGVGPGGVGAFAPGATGNAAPLSTIAGPNTGMKRITNIAVGAARDVYLTDYRPALLVYAAGAHGNVAPIRTISGTRTGLDFPTDVAVDERGVAYVVNDDDDAGKYSVTVYGARANGNVAPLRTIGGANSELNSPIAVAVDAQFNIYVLNSGGVDVLVFDARANGNVAPSRILHSESFTAPSGIAVTAAGAIYVTNSQLCSTSGGCHGANAILRFPAGAHGLVNPSKRIAGPSTGIQDPGSIALGAQGRIYVADLETLSILVFAAGATGNAHPAQTIHGSNTGFDTYPGPIGIDVR